MFPNYHFKHTCRNVLIHTSSLVTWESVYVPKDGKQLASQRQTLLYKIMVNTIPFDCSKKPFKNLGTSEYMTDNSHSNTLISKSWNKRSGRVSARTKCFIHNLTVENTNQHRRKYRLDQILTPTSHPAMLLSLQPHNTVADPHVIQ